MSLPEFIILIIFFIFWLNHLSRKMMSQEIGQILIESVASIYKFMNQLFWNWRWGKFWILFASLAKHHSSVIKTIRSHNDSQPYKTIWFRLVWNNSSMQKDVGSLNIRWTFFYFSPLEQHFKILHLNQFAAVECYCWLENVEWHRRRHFSVVRHFYQSNHQPC